MGCGKRGDDGVDEGENRSERANEGPDEEERIARSG